MLSVSLLLGRVHLTCPLAIMALIYGQQAKTGSLQKPKGTEFSRSSLSTQVPRPRSKLLLQTDTGQELPQGLEPRGAGQGKVKYISHLAVIRDLWYHTQS